MAFTIRPAEVTDLPFLFDMLWEAAAVDAGMREIGKAAALALPYVSKYIDGYGRPGDGGVIAVDSAGSPIGAAWYRLFPAEEPGYGYIAPDLPELSIGVSDSARGQGVGGAMIDALLAMANVAGFRGVSLSVDRQNPAVALYERHDFRDAGVSGLDETSVTMVIFFGDSQ